MEDGMTTRIAALFLLGALAFAPGLAAAADETHTLEQTMVENANTPAEHQALANHFRERAAGARAEAREHDRMANTYMPSGQPKMSWGTVQARQKMAGHCKQISQQSESIAKGFDALAASHDEEAKKAQ
jgi:hypothetical protein